MSGVYVYCVSVLERSVFVVVTVTRSSHPTSSSSIIIAHRTRRRRLCTIIQTQPTSTRGGVILNWLSATQRHCRWTPRHTCTPGRTSRPCLTEAVDDVSTIISIITINTSAFFCSIFNIIHRIGRCNENTMKQKERKKYLLVNWQ